MIPCECPACAEPNAFDRETETDEMILLGTNLLTYITLGDRYELFAGNVNGYQLIWETHSV